MVLFALPFIGEAVGLAAQGLGAVTGIKQISQAGTTIRETVGVTGIVKTVQDVAGFFAPKPRPAPSPVVA